MLSRITVIAGAVAASAISSSAIAQVQYRYAYRQPTFAEIFFDCLFSALTHPLVLLLLAAWAALHIIPWAIESSRESNEPCNCAECVAERETSLMHEITKHQDAHTAMMRSDIELTRIAAVYGERPDIAAHEQRLHELRNQLQQGARK